MSNNSSPKFLQNIPKGEDLFEGKSQEKVADVIINILSSENFQIIGIDGGWGMGKSNLVKIIENKLTDYNFFNYDVWGHQEDEQRRAILIELTEFISDNKRNIVTDKKKWSEKLKKLLAKEKEVTIINRPYLSVGFIFSLLSIIYVPLVNAFKDSLVDIFGAKNLFWKLCLVLLPIFIVLGIYLYHLIKFWLNKTNFWQSFKQASQETFQIYTNKQKEETKIETISENEPSVKDFRNWMSEIDSDLGKKKLILVFDNFDRLPRRHILSIWSSIHIFFSDNKYKNIKVIIPFDRNHIKNAFKDLNGEKNDYANDYINKTFDLVYRVSPPILSDWKSFLRKCWNEAFDNFNEEEFIKIEQIYEVFRKTITPRDIIAFVNEVVSIKLLNKNIPDKYIALFVINKDVILEDSLKAIIDSTFLEGLTYLYKDDEDFQKYITALSYQINPDNALEVVYRKQLKNSLLNKNIELFKEISKTSVFSKIIQPTLSELENFENPILVLEAIEEGSKITIVEKQSLWDNIYLQVRDTIFSEFGIKEFQKILLKNISHSYKKALIKIILNSLYESKEFDAVIYSDIIDDLNSYIKSNSIEINIFEFLDYKNVSVEKFIPLINNKDHNYRDYRILCNEQDLDKYLSTITLDKLEDTYFVEHLSSDFRLKSFEATLKEKIATNKTDKDILAKLFKVLKYISGETIGLLLTDVEIYTLFSQLSSDDDLYYDFIAMRLAYGQNFGKSYEAVFDGLLNTDEDNLVKKIAERIELFITYEEYLLNSLLFNNSMLYKAVLREIVEFEYNTNRADIMKLLPKFEDICLINNLDPQLFINDLDEWGDYNFESALIKSLPNYYFEEARKNDSKLATISLDLIAKYFNGLLKEEWADIFNNLEGKEIKLLKIIAYNEWNSYSLEALKELLITIAKSAIVPKIEILNEVIENFELSNKDLTNSFKDVRDELISNRNMNPELFILFSKWLFKYSSLYERSGEVIRTIFKTELLDNEECLSILLTEVSIIKKLLESSSSSDASDLREGVIDRRGNEKVREFGTLVGIDWED